MDRRGWPWKRKSSEKLGSPSDSAGTSLARAASLGDQDTKKVNYVQISLDSYNHLSGLEGQVNTLENQVKTLENQVNDLEGKLATAYLDVSSKENLVKQHEKFAEEAVSGWEKADAEARVLKQQLESVILLKLSAEDRVSHLDGALKECMRQIRNLKEENELKLQETSIAKAKQLDKMKLDFEAKTGELNSALLQAGAENTALSQSLQEHLSTIMTINKERSHAEAELELLKGNIQSREKEISALKYELHVVSKELDIRNQEKNMNLKAIEAANKQHLENVKKITKLEAECQRLRGLVRKKLPGPAALARMRFEVESFGQDWNETSLWRNSAKNPAASLFPKACLTSESLKQYNRESEFPGKRFLQMEEEIKTLREALSACNTELQASKSMYAKTTSRLKILEAQLNQQTRSSSSGVPIEVISGQVESTPSSVTSISEDGIDEEGSSTGSWGPLVSDISQLWKDKSIDKSTKSSSVNLMQLMDDFLEMEKLACSSADSDLSKTGLDSIENSGDIASVDAKKDVTRAENEDSSQFKIEPQSSHSHFSKLLFRICTMLESLTLEADVKELLEDIKLALAPYASCCDCKDKVPLLENKDGSCIQDPDGAKLQLQGAEQLLADLKSQLESSERSHSLVKVQLKCMTESYKLLELRTHDLEIEVKVLQDKVEKLESELLEEKHNHGDTLAALEELQHKFKRDLQPKVCTLSAAADSSFETEQGFSSFSSALVHANNNAVLQLMKQQEREIPSTAEKLSECQETVHLSKQLQALRPQSDMNGLQSTDGHLVEDKGSL